MSIAIFGNKADLSQIPESANAIILECCIVNMAELKRLNWLTHITMKNTECDFAIRDFADFPKLICLILDKVITTNPIDINSLNLLKLNYFQLVARPDSKIDIIAELRLDQMISLHLANIGDHGKLLEHITAKSLQSLYLSNSTENCLSGIDRFTELAILTITNSNIIRLDRGLNILTQLLVFRMENVGIMPYELEYLDSNIIRVIDYPTINEHIVGILKNRSSCVKSARKFY